MSRSLARALAQPLRQRWPPPRLPLPLPPPLLRRAAASVSTAPPPAPADVGPTNPWARPAPWLGAYYQLRQGDPAAMHNRERRRGKAAPKRGRFITQEVERREVARRNVDEPWRDMKGFDRGDILEVEHRPADVGSDGPTERVVGVCIAKVRRRSAPSLSRTARTLTRPLPPPRSTTARLARRSGCCASRTTCPSSTSSPPTRRSSSRSTCARAPESGRGCQSSTTSASAPPSSSSQSRAARKASDADGRHSGFGAGGDRVGSRGV